MCRSEMAYTLFSTNLRGCNHRAGCRSVPMYCSTAVTMEYYYLRDSTSIVRSNRQLAELVATLLFSINSAVVFDKQHTLCMWTVLVNVCYGRRLYNSCVRRINMNIHYTYSLYTNKVRLRVFAYVTRQHMIQVPIFTNYFYELFWSEVVLCPKLHLKGCWMFLPIERRDWKKPAKFALNVRV